MIFFGGVLPLLRLAFWFAVLHVALAGQSVMKGFLGCVVRLAIRFPALASPATWLVAPVAGLLVGGLQELVGVAAIRVFRLRGDL